MHSLPCGGYLISTAYWHFLFVTDLSQVFESHNDPVPVEQKDTPQPGDGIGQAAESKCCSLALLYIWEVVYLGGCIFGRLYIGRLYIWEACFVKPEQVNPCCWYCLLTLSSLSFWSWLSHPWIWTGPLLFRGLQSKIKNRMANSIDSDEMAHYELITSHLI